MRVPGSAQTGSPILHASTNGQDACDAWRLAARRALAPALPAGMRSVYCTQRQRGAAANICCLDFTRPFPHPVARPAFDAQPSTKLKAGVVHGQDLIDLMQHAQDNKYAIPAVNCTSSSIINAVMESAKVLSGRCVGSAAVHTKLVCTWGLVKHTACSSVLTCDAPRAASAPQEVNSPVMVQFSNGGGSFIAGKGISNKNEQSSIAGSIAVRFHILQYCTALTWGQQ